MFHLTSSLKLELKGHTTTTHFSLLFKSSQSQQSCHCRSTIWLWIKMIDSLLTKCIDTRNSSQMKVKREQAQTLKAELDSGLEKWRQQVLEVQENNIRRAEQVAAGQLTVRRQRSREERRTRERRVRQRRRESKEREELELREKQEAIQEKQKRESSGQRIKLCRCCNCWTRS